LKKIGVVGVPGGWSSEKLAEVLAELTGFRCLVDLSGVHCDLDSGRAYWGEVELTGLDGLMVKKIGPAYSPGLLDRLELLRLIAARGVRIFSSPGKIQRVLNRLTCTVQLWSAGVAIPPTVITEDPGQATRAVERFGRAVLKPLYTSKARGMVVIEPGLTLREEIENYKASGNEIIYVQKMVDLPGRDLGLVFLGGRYLATYARVCKKGAWNTTTNLGGHYEAHAPDPAVIELAHRAQKIFGLDFTCVDVAETDRGPMVFEVSAFGGFRGLMEGCGIDAARAYTEYVLTELNK